MINTAINTKSSWRFFINYSGNEFLYKTFWTLINSNTLAVGLTIHQAVLTTTELKDKQGYEIKHNVYNLPCRDQKTFFTITGPSPVIMHRFLTDKTAIVKRGRACFGTRPTFWNKQLKSLWLRTWKGTKVGEQPPASFCRSLGSISVICGGQSDIGTGFPPSTLVLLTYSMEQSPSWEANWFCS